MTCGSAGNRPLQPSPYCLPRRCYHKTVQFSFAWEDRRRYYTVGELTEAIRGTLAGEFTDIWVAGEISGSKTAPSGHVYFTLKDADAQIRCACFARTLRFLRFKPQDGIEVLARGRVDVYAPRGEYQLLIDSLEPQGHGALQFAFEQLKKKLAEEGLFDAERKRKLPLYPRRIGIVTSPSGAAIQDMLKILTSRFPGLHIRLFPALVQGEGAAAQVCRGIEYFSETGWPEVVIVGRGGGSVEDLWTFNEESVARAIAACRVPVISAVGHETDFTISDFVADLRAPTPSAAAEMVVGSQGQLVERLEAIGRRLRQSVLYRISVARRRLQELSVDRAAATLHRAIGRRLQRVDALDARMRESARASSASGRERIERLEQRLARFDLRLRLAEGRRRLEAAASRLDQSIQWRLAAQRRRLEPLDAQLAQLSPLRVLDRGYAIVQTPQGAVVKNASEVTAGSLLDVRLARGALRVEVESSSG